MKNMNIYQRHTTLYKRTVLLAVNKW